MTNPFDSIDARLSNIEILLLDLTHNKQTAPTLPPTTPDPIRLYGDRSAASYLGCSIMTVQALRRSGAISFYRTGRKVFYISSELDESLKVQNRKFSRKISKI